MKSNKNIQRLDHTKFTSCSSDFVLKTLERASDLKMLIYFYYKVNLVWSNLCIFWLPFICLYRSWSWSLPNFVWMNISRYQNGSQNIQRLGHTRFTSCSSDLVLNVNFFSIFFWVIFDERNVKYYAENIILIFFIIIPKITLRGPVNIPERPRNK
jgi:hypothetical protein